MTKIDDGGPAFPVSFNETNEHGVQFPFVERGMSLRDWFAGQAPINYDDEVSIDVVAAYIGTPHPGPGHGVTWTPQHKIACQQWWDVYDTRRRYAWADAMLAARAEGGAE